MIRIAKCLPVFGLPTEVMLGFSVDLEILHANANYLPIAVLAAYRALFGGIRAHLQGHYDEVVFVTGYFYNIALAACLAFLGVHLGVDW